MELDVHHVDYKNLFDVETGDLKTLCRPCHKKYHIIHGMPVRSKAPLYRSQLLPDKMLISNKDKAITEFQTFSSLVLDHIKSKRKIKAAEWKGLEHKVKSLKRAITDWHSSIFPD